MKKTSAVPYLLEFLAQEKSNWMNYLGNYVLLYSDKDLSEDAKPELLELFDNGKDFKIGVEEQSSTKPELKKEAEKERIRLENLSSFQNYKKLSNSMEILFHPKLTVVFGPNGTGKTSLSSAIKILAHTTKPTNPLENIYNKVKNPTSPSFSFKLSSLGNKTWTQGEGFGLFHRSIKFFDSSIAINYLDERPDTNKVIEIAPFKLEVFEYLERRIAEFKDLLHKKGEKLESKVLKEALEISLVFQKEKFVMKNPFESIDVDRLGSLKSLITVRSTLSSEQVELRNKLSEQINDLEKLTSKEGLKALTNELEEIRKFNLSLIKVSQDLKSLALDTYLNDLDKINSLREHQKVLLQEVAPKPEKVSEFKEFIKHSKDVVDYTTESFSKCILCGKTIDDDALKVIAAYYEFLNSDIETKINDLVSSFAARKELHTSLKLNFASMNSLPVRVKTEIKDIEDRIRLVSLFLEKGQELLKEDATFGSVSLSLFDEDKKSIQRIVTDLDLLIKNANTEFLGNSTKLEKLRNEKEIISFQEFLFNNNSKITEFEQSLQRLEAFIKKINIDFTSILRRRSLMAKKASEELLVSEFASTFNMHYEDLAEKKLEALGLEIVPFKDGGIDVKVGKSKIKQILSEGEQKVYALSLFFAELEFEGSDIIVFDDPVSSLDYHYVDSFCRKLKNYIMLNPDRQIIIFTHDWYFLKDLQDCLHVAKLKEETNFLILRLNNCSNTTKNIESIEALEKSIDKCLANNLIPLEEVIKLSQDMRSLIECIVNKHIFNDQRTQYKRDRLNPSVFYEYSGLISLTKKEVLELDDLYATLSKYNHDNPIKEFKEADLEQFKVRYDKIKKLKADFIKRKKETFEKNELLVN